MIKKNIYIYIYIFIGPVTVTSLIAWKTVAKNFEPQLVDDPLNSKKNAALFLDLPRTL